MGTGYAVALAAGVCCLFVSPAGAENFAATITGDVGARSQASLGQNWSVQTYADIGSFGIGSHFTWQVVGLIQYDLSSRWSLTGGWRHLDLDHDHDGFVFDASMDGPILGAVYRF